MEITKEQLEDLYLNQGLSVRKTAEALGLPTHGSVTWYLKKYGIPRRPSKFQRGNQINKGRRPETCTNWKGGKETIRCDGCSKKFKRWKSQIKDTTNFCSMECRSLWRSRNFVGEGNPNYGSTAMFGANNPNWKGGISCDGYCDAWKDRGFKAEIRMRDGNTCQGPDCRKTTDKLTIHHVDYDKRNCSPRNLLALCISCNARENYNRPFWQEVYEAIMSRKYSIKEIDKERKNAC